MAVRRIFRIDVPEEQKILKTRSHAVKLPNPGLKQLVADMFETMDSVHGVGLAAPQVGLNQRLAVITIPPVVEERDDGSLVELEPSQDYVLLNPEVIKASDQEVLGQEGCLSLPGWYGDVPRASWVTVEYQDLDGRRQRIRRATGLLARALQHEIDHLDGVLFTERMRDLSTLKEHRPEDESVETQ